MIQCAPAQDEIRWFKWILRSSEGPEPAEEGPIKTGVEPETAEGRGKAVAANTTFVRAMMRGYSYGKHGFQAP
jgi:hypothetical protein